MIKPKIIFFAFFLFLFEANSQSDIERMANKLNNEAFVHLQRNNFYESFRLLDSISLLLKSTQLYDQKAKNLNIYGLAYSQVGSILKAELFFKLSMITSDSITDSIKTKSRRVTAGLNLQRLYARAENHELYYKNFDDVRRIALEMKDEDHIFHEYSSEMLVLHQQKKYSELYRLALKAINEIDSKQDVFRGEIKQADYLRLKTEYEIYLAFAMMELNEDGYAEKANALINKLLGRNLEETLWEETKTYIDIAQLNYYKLFYFHKYEINKDSIDFYLNTYNRQNIIANKFLEKQELKNGQFLVENIENLAKLEKVKLQLKAQEEKSLRIKIILALKVLLALILIVFIYLQHKNILFKSKVNKVIKDQYLQLVQNIKKKKELEIKIDNIQDEFGKDLHDNFGNRLAAIETAHNILTEISSKDTFDKKLFDKFSTSLKSALINLSSDFKDLLWANNSQNNSLYKITERIEYFAKKMEMTHNLVINVIKELDVDLKTPKYWNRQLVLIIKEVLTNSLKYSQTSKIDLIIKCNKEGEFNIICRDYGIGFNQDNLKRISGLNNMKHRANSIDCKLQITSQINQGTIISLTCKIPKI